MKILFSFLLTIVSQSFLYSQNTFPKFKGVQKSFQEYIFSSLTNIDSSFSSLCDTSIGLIQFSINEEGIPDSIVISEGFPQEVSASLFDIVSLSRWQLVKKDSKTFRNASLILPIAICIETGCKEGEIRRGFGVGGDFIKMFPANDNPLYVNCILMEPLTYTAIKRK